MQIAADKAVTFHYTLSEADGTHIETSRERAPQAYLHGHRSLLPALETQLAGHAAGDTLSVTLTPEQAYGQPRQGATQRVPIKNLVFRGKLVPGQVVGIRSDRGLRHATVVKAGKFNADLDFNHPLAGKTLVFDIEIVAVRDATPEELAHRHVHGEGGHHH